MPLSPAVMVVEVVALSGEVYPLGMSELISHEVEVSVSAQSDCEESYNLMKRHASVNDKVRWRAFAHGEVDFSVKEPHGDGLVADYGLVV